MSGLNVTFNDLTAADFERLVERSIAPSVVFFHKNTCGPCRSFHSVFESIAARWYKQIPFYKFDTLLSPEIGEENVGYTFPTVVIFDQGILFAKHIGATNSEYFNNFITRQMSLLEKKKQMQVLSPQKYAKPKLT